MLRGVRRARLREEPRTPTWLWTSAGKCNIINFGRFSLTSTERPTQRKDEKSVVVLETDHDSDTFTRSVPPHEARASHRSVCEVFTQSAPSSVSLHGTGGFVLPR